MAGICYFDPDSILARVAFSDKSTAHETPTMLVDIAVRPEKSPCSVEKSQLRHSRRVLVAEVAAFKIGS